MEMELNTAKERMTILAFEELFSVGWKAHEYGI